jgi:hypothetical protein
MRKPDVLPAQAAARIAEKRDRASRELVCLALMLALAALLWRILSIW